MLKRNFKIGKTMLIVGCIFLLYGFLPTNAQQDSVILRIEEYPSSVVYNGKELVLKSNIDTTWIKVEWLGNITAGSEYNGIDPGFYGDNPPASIWMRKDIIIGLREDGILVWKKEGKK
jgi:hypothetical protein